MKINQYKKPLTLTIFVIAGVIYAFNTWISFQYPVWMDEAITIKYYINYENPFQVIKDLYVGVDVYPPLYYFAGSFLYHVSGKSVTIMSLFTKLLLLASIVILLLELRKKFDLSVLALIALMLSSTSGFMFMKNFEVRSYGLFFFLVTISFINYIRFKEQNKSKHLVYFTLVNILILYTHYFGAFLMLSIFIVELSVSLKTKNHKLPISILISGLFFIPWIPAIINQYNNIDGYYYHKIPDLKDLIKLPYSFLGPYHAGLLLALLASGTIVFLRKKKLTTIISENRYFLTFTLATIVLVVMSFILAQFKISVYYPRYFISLVLSILLITAIIIKYLDRNSVVVYVLAILLMIASTLETIKFHKEKDNFRYWISFYQQFETPHTPFVCEVSRHYYTLDYYSNHNNFIYLLDNKYIDELEDNSKEFFGYHWNKGMKDTYDINSIVHYDEFISKHDSFYFLTESNSYFKRFYFKDTTNFDIQKLFQDFYLVKKK